jgi:glycopeptide antibiotics resistance protein
MVISLLIEATQGTALWGAVPCRYRVADVDDLILNVFGTWLGILVARLIPTEVKAFD